MLDYIIVGLGLAGASTAFRLEEMGKSFLVFEDGTVNSSKVAGGVMNPVILKRFTLAWKADEQLKDAKEFYSRMENHLGIKFFSPVEIYRKFSSIEEQNDWFAAADRPQLAPFLDSNLRKEITPAIPSEFAFGKVLHTARVDTRKLLDSYSEYLLKNDKLQDCSFVYEDLNLAEDHVEYQGMKAKKIVFAEGFGLRKNPFFNYLPLVGNKGEYILIKAPDLDLKVVVKSSVFISPLGDDKYVVGATYNNQDKTPEPSKEAREELTRKLDRIITVPYEVIGQVAGIRPSTGDRRPLVGKHPEIKNIYCCNGFGSRGVLIAPAASAELLNFIEHNTAISAEYDLSRFAKRYLKRN